MNGAGRRLSRLERRPWTLAVLAGAGITLLVPSVLALYGPPELLDAAVAFGDAGLAAGLAGLFAISTLCLRLLLRRRRLVEEELDEEPPVQRNAPNHEVEDAPAAAARAHLR